MMNLKNKLANLVFNKLFLTAPEMDTTPEQKVQFDAQYEFLQTKPNNGEPAYRCSAPKQAFLRYLVREKDVLLHGSNQLDLVVLKPKEQSDWQGKMRTAVFASGDGIWPMFFATVDHANYRGSLRNGCFVIGEDGRRDNRYYFFSLNAQYQHKGIWCNGMVYILPKDPFKKTSQGKIRFDEWACERAVKPIAQLKITPRDFPFLDNVTWHDENESIYTTWIRYKKRQKPG